MPRPRVCRVYHHTLFQHNANFHICHALALVSNHRTSSSPPTSVIATPKDTATATTKPRFLSNQPALCPPLPPFPFSALHHREAVVQLIKRGSTFSSVTLNIPAKTRCASRGVKKDQGCGRLRGGCCFSLGGKAPRGMAAYHGSMTCQHRFHFCHNDIRFNDQRLLGETVAGIQIGEERVVFANEHQFFIGCERHAISHSSWPRHSLAQSNQKYGSLQFLNTA